MKILENEFAIILFM